MNKKLRYTPLLLLAPLLMANAPAPQPLFDYYDNVQVSIVSQNKKGSEQYGYRYDYVFEVTNKGDCYIAVGFGEAQCTFYTREGGSQRLIGGPMVDNLFNNEATAPGQTKQYKITDETSDFSTYDLSKFGCFALTIRDDDVTYENASVTRKGEKKYQLNIKKITGKGDYYYYGVVDVTYKGNDHSFVIRGDKENDFGTTSILDLDQLEIKDIKFFRSQYNTYKPKLHPEEVMMYVVAIGIIVLMVSAVAAAIVVPIVIVKRRKKKAGKQYE